ncbi:type II toxin-antitoxin system VapC family toxin [Promineifilum sp.]|uniref:type II toxin-antitoxin system VapC family toxin n=1 Tax=Promineifilum sp. TaxID=2664178 RepID=UPI0035B3E831
MKLLFDTHTFLWGDGEPERLSSTVLSLCQDPANVLLLSVASAWEMQIKAQLGKLKLKQPLARLVRDQQRANDLRVLPIVLKHVIALQKLPDYYRDPFDRLLVAQAMIEKAVLLTRDTHISQYGIEVAW